MAEKQQRTPSMSVEKYGWLDQQFKKAYLHNRPIKTLRYISHTPARI